MNTIPLEHFKCRRQIVSQEDQHERLGDESTEGMQWPEARRLRMPFNNSKRNRASRQASNLYRQRSLNGNTATSHQIHAGVLQPLDSEETCSGVGRPPKNGTMEARVEQGSWDNHSAAIEWTTEHNEWYSTTNKNERISGIRRWKIPKHRKQFSSVLRKNTININVQIEFHY